MGTLARNGLMVKWMFMYKSTSLLKKCPYSEFLRPAFSRIRAEYRIFLRIQSECGKMWTRKTPNLETFHAGYTKTNERKQAVWHCCIIALPTNRYRKNNNGAFSSEMAKRSMNACPYVILMISYVLSPFCFWY